MGLPMLRKMSILTHKVSSHLFDPPSWYSPFSYFGCSFFDWRNIRRHSFSLGWTSEYEMWDYSQLQLCIPYPTLNTASGCAALQGKKNVTVSRDTLLTVCTLRSNLSDSSPTCPILHSSGTKFSRNKNHLHSFRWRKRMHNVHTVQSRKCIHLQVPTWKMVQGYKYIRPSF